MSAHDHIFVPTADLPPGGMRAVDADGVKILLCRVGDAFYAIENRCPHAMVPLESGRLEGCVLECPLHGGKLDVRDGRPVAQPIRRTAQRYPVRAVQGGVEVQLETEAAGSAPPPRSSAQGGSHA